MMTCRVCGSNSIELEVKAREMMIPTREEFSYFECARCHCLQIAEVPKNLESYYGDDYYSYHDVEEGVFDADITDMTPVLDVGSGSGKFLKKLRKMGYGNLTGCDPFLPKELCYEENFRIYKKTIHEMEGSFGQIFFNDSFEHVTDPHEVIASAKRLLAPGGIISIKIPVYPNIAFDMFGADWYQLDAPRHIILHSKESMEILAGSYNLSIVEMEYDPEPSQIFRSLLYSKDIPFWDQKMEMIIKEIGRDEVNNIRDLCIEAANNEYSDHATFYLASK